MQTYNDFEESETGKAGRKKSDVAILGVPFDMGSSNHAGQCNAPWAICQAGFWQEDMTQAYTGIDPMDSLEIVDCGDVEITPGDVEGGWKRIKDTTKTVYANTRHLIAMGGDHPCSAKIIEGIAAIDGHPLTVFHFDAHTDYWKHDPGVEMNHGTWVRRVLDEGAANRVVQFGVRGWGNSSSERKWAEKNDITTYYAVTPNWSQALFDEIRDTSDSIYLSIDLDVLDPAFAPGVAFQEPAGLTTRELFQAVYLIASSGKMVGADVMECIPDRDPTGTTVKVANRLVAQLLTGIAGKGR